MNTAKVNTAFPRRELIILALLTVLWGLNWPVMKIAVTDYPPWLFRGLTLFLGVLLIAMYMVWNKLSFVMPRSYWAQFAWLTLLNVLIGHAISVYAVKYLSSGRVAILGYTMPIWVVIFSIVLDKAVLTRKEWLGILATTVGIAALLWDEFAQLTGKPFWVGAMLVTAAAWGLGTLELRRKPAPTHISSTTITFWMLCVASVVIITGSITLERPQWRYPNQTEWWAIAYTGTAAIAFAHVAFTHLARTLPSVTLSLSMMLIPIVGVFSGAWLLGESVRGADWVALCAVVLAMWAVLNRK